MRSCPDMQMLHPLHRAAKQCYYWNFVTIQRKRYTARSQTPVWECICSRNSGFSPVY
ncbi:hypothetical protein KsCSTR_16050 [Candidatus Kuenenia stuttgartiensis]|uniref:Uncharacterized protein n=1 Tax=Kuenenia stuttgartiensis TaxID=174633 RepID=Q1Q1S4_KUEST|nr:hypothetical protein KsCSTR_16050 [Candidatus Kuenenia stuttgartiensis]CAJ73961.1 unknown protein [Candidatus Kuenenia stuttgartiensis]